MPDYQFWPMNTAERLCAEHCEVHGESAAVVLHVPEKGEDGWMIVLSFPDGVFMADDVAKHRLEEYVEVNGPCAMTRRVDGKGSVIAIQPGCRLCPHCGNEGKGCQACNQGWVRDEHGEGDI